MKKSLACRNGEEAAALRVISGHMWLKYIFQSVLGRSCGWNLAPIVGQPHDACSFWPWTSAVAAGFSHVRAGPAGAACDQPVRRRPSERVMALSPVGADVAVASTSRNDAPRRDGS